jgi:hypothetical protein
MKLIDFINMIIKEKHYHKKIKYDGNIYVLKTDNCNYCGVEYLCKIPCLDLFSDLDLDSLIYLANQEVEIVEE